MENYKTIEEKVDSLNEDYLKQILRRLILGYVMTHKLPWTNEIVDVSHIVIRDAWNKPILTSPSKYEAEEIIILAEYALDRQKELFPDGYKKILHLWKTIEKEDRDIERALRKEDENDFRNMPLIS